MTKTDLVDAGNDDDDVTKGNGKPLDIVLETGVTSCDAVHEAIPCEKEYMDKDVFPEGVQQAVFLKEFAQEHNEHVETFDLKSNGNFPGSKIFSSFAMSFDSLEIKVVKQVVYSMELSAQLTSKYKQLGFINGEVSMLSHADNIHIIITVSDDSKKEIIGHLCCRSALDNKVFVVVLMAMFEHESITRRNGFGSMLLVLAEEVKNIIHNDKGKHCSFYVSFNSNLDDKGYFRKFLHSCYFENDKVPTKGLQRYLKAPVKMNYYYRPVFPVILTTALFLWRIPREINNFPYCCKQVLCYLLQGWKMRRINLNRKQSHTSSILKEVFPGKTVENHSLLPSIKKAPVIGERVSDEILQSLVQRVKTTISQNSEDYVPGLFVSDLGYRKCELKNPSLIGTKDKKYNEAHCLFFNAAHALFSDAKKYIILRRLLCLIFHILSRLPEDHPFLSKHSSYSWFFCNIATGIPLRVLQYVLLNNEEIDEWEKNHNGSPFDKDTYEKVQKNLTEENGILFDYHISNPKDFLQISNEGTILQKKKMYQDIARCYLCDDFQGDSNDLMLLGKMFAVAFRIYTITVTDASNGDVEIKENKSKGKGKAKAKAKAKVKSPAKKKTYDFAIDDSIFGWSITDTNDLPMFNEDNDLYGIRHMTHMFCFALTGTTDGHYLYFSDTNFDERSKTLVPLQNLKELAESNQKSLIDKFLELSHDYQQPIVIDKGNKSVSYEDYLFVHNKPIMFTAKGYDQTGIEIKNPLSRNASILQNFNAITSGIGNSKIPEVITGHNMERVKTYSWKNLCDMFKQSAKKRNSTSYNQIDCCIMHSILSDAVVTPTFVRDNDWIDRYFPSHDPHKPQDQKFLITSTRHSFMNFHIDFGGSAFWYHLLNGQKEFILIECTDNNFGLYESFVDARKEKKDDLEFLAHTVSNLYPETIYRITLRAGQTLVVPMGYFHSVYTPLDSIAILGTFFYDSGASVSLAIHNEIECFDINNTILPYYRQMFILALGDFYDRYDGKNIESKHIRSMIESNSKWHKQTPGKVNMSSAIITEMKKKQNQLAESKGFKDFPAFLSAFCKKHESLKSCNIPLLESDESEHAAEPATPRIPKPPKKADGAEKDKQNDPLTTPKDPLTKYQTNSSPDKKDQLKNPLNSSNIPLLESNKSSSKLPTAEQTNSLPAKKRSRLTDEHAAEPATSVNPKPPQKTDVAENFQQKDSLTTPNVPKVPLTKDQTNSMPDRKDQQKDPLTSCNISFLEINENSSKRPTVDQTNSSPVKKRSKLTDKVEPAAELTKPQNNQTKEQTMSSPAKNDQQNDTPNYQDQMSSPTTKKITKSTSFIRDQQKAAPNQTYSSSQTTRPQKNQDQNEFQNSNWVVLAKTPPNKIAQQKARERARKTSSKTKNLLREDVPLFFETNAEGIIVNTKMLLAGQGAFSLYFSLAAYTDSVDGCKNSCDFVLTLNCLYEKIKGAISRIGTCWAMDVGRDKIQDCGLTQSYKWNVDVGFHEWSASSDQLPLVRWIKIKEDEHAAKFGIRANRKFVADEVIGLFWGDRLGDDEIPSEFAFENAHGIFDAKGGLHTMAVHLMSVSLIKDEFNARLSHDFLVRAVRNIEVKEEIILTYDTKTVWKPKKNHQSIGKNKVKKVT